MICYQSFHLNCVNNSDNENPHSDQTDDTWYCAECPSLPFSNLQDADFYKEVNSNGNPIINDLTLLTKKNGFKSSPFSFGVNCNDGDIDPLSNYIIRQTSNNYRCHYYIEESFSNLKLPYKGWKRKSFSAGKSKMQPRSQGLSPLPPYNGGRGWRGYSRTKTCDISIRF